MIDIIEKFINPTLEDSHHRYKSWEHCYLSFNNNENSEIQVLKMGFYLASWGMYRGSSGLLWKDYTIHYGALEKLKKYNHLKYVNVNDKYDINGVLSLVDEMKDYYSRITYYKKGQPKKISATDTLVSKVILGSLGCMPAMDRYFNQGFCKMEHLVINENSLTSIYNTAQQMASQINEAQHWIYEKTKVTYPTMKIVDMYHWQIGFDKDN